MEDKQLERLFGNPSTSVAPEAISPLKVRMLLVLGIVVGLAPLGCAAVFASAPSEFLQEIWLSGAGILFVIEWVVVAVIRGVSNKKSVQSLTKGIMWGLGITAGVALFRLLALAYYIVTF